MEISIHIIKAISILALCFMLWSCLKEKEFLYDLIRGHQHSGRLFPSNWPWWLNIVSLFSYCGIFIFCYYGTSHLFEGLPDSFGQLDEYGEWITYESILSGWAALLLGILFLNLLVKYIRYSYANSINK